MPVVSERQRRAMLAAKAGHSTLGIPQSVGAEFVAASRGIKNLPKRAPAARKAKAEPAHEYTFGSLAPRER